MSAGKPAANAVWIIGGKILLALLHLGVSMTAARRLGPGGFGEIQYAAAVTGLLLPLCTLGLHDVLIPELVLHPQNSGVALGSALGMRLAASLGVLVLWGFLLQWTGQGEGGSVAFLYGVSLVFQAAEPLGDWFRSRLQSRWPALISCAAAVAAGLCQLGLLPGRGRNPVVRPGPRPGGRRGSAPPDFGLLPQLRQAAPAMGFRHSPDALEPGAALSPVRPTGGPVRSNGPADAPVHGRGGRCGLVRSRRVHQRPVDLWRPPLWWKRPRPLLLARFRQDPAGFRQGLAALYGLLWYGSCLAALVICLLSRPLLLLLYGQAYCPASGNSLCCGLAACLLLPGHRAKYFFGSASPVPV